MLPRSGAPTSFINAAAVSETLIGTDANDQLKTFYGSIGASESFMSGGLGDDTYIVLSSKDKITENPGEGIDTVTSDWFYVLPSNVENLFLTGSLSVGATGNELDNVIVGNSGKNIIDGKAGGDELTGGAGDDMFVLSGNDTVMDFQTGDYFDLRGFTGVTNFAQVQSSMVQLGADTVLNLGLNNVVTIKNALVSQLTESNFLLSSDLANYKLTFADEFNGFSLNTGTGSDGTWYPLFPRAGLAGHTTADHGSVQYFTYPDDTGTFGQPIGINPFSVADGVLTITMDKVPQIEQKKVYGYDYTSGMINTIATFSQTYGYFEIRAKLAPGQGLHDSFWMLPVDGSWPPELDIVEQKGNDPTNILTVSHAEDGGQHISHSKQYVVSTATTEFHTYGLDWEPDFLTWYIDGVAVRTQPTWPGMDVPMYLLASLGGGGLWAGVPDSTTPFPAQMQIDYIRAYASANTLEKGVPFNKLGTAGADVMYGTSLGDTLNGGLGDDTIYAGAGNDTLIGGGGNDLLDGGFGNDTYVIGATSEKISEGGNNGIDLIQTALASYTLGINVENLSYTGSGIFNGAGNVEDNVIQGGDFGNTLGGGDGSDWLKGGAGIDQLNGGDGNDREDGGAGDDTLRGNNGDDVLHGQDGADLIKGDDGNDAIYGDTGNDNLQGNAGNDLLDGGAGKDRMAGGTGDDTFIVDVSVDSVIELTGEGIDTVRTTLNTYTLGANVENLVFAGLGNFAGTGNDLANYIAGGTGVDTLSGGAGDDSYVVDNSGDVVIEVAGGGVDTIITSLATFKLADGLENVTYTGVKGFTGTGNSAANSINGAGGADRLDGLAGADTMAGGLGNDTYVVENVGDQVIEAVGAGSDRIISQVSFAASENIETLQLSTSKAINATGNALSNTLIGNGGANVLDGRGGADVLTGGGGVDTFQFQRGEAQGDVVKDFAGAGVLGGDILRFVGFGADASITQVGSSDLFAIHAGADFGGATEVIQLLGVAHIAAGDYIFV